MAQDLFSINLSEHFTLREMTRSETALKKHIDNTPSTKVVRNLTKLANQLLEPIRQEWQEPIIITSGYRCTKLNTAIKGAKTSQHCQGAAADFQAKDKSKNRDLFNLIKKMLDNGEIECRQLIWEFGNKTNPDWIHISIQDDKHEYRKNQVLYLGVK